jgi:adenine-specific DNA-methyltransferase
MPPTLIQTIQSVQAEVVVLSYNNESWVTVEDLEEACSVHGHVVQLAFDSKRYVGAQIGIHSPTGQKVGEVSHLRNLEYVILAGPKKTVERMASAVGGAVAAPSA